ncbi:F-box associated domain type 1 [Arabidopsis suecica]|uniref:F-box associated domain type 1 n=1 Tax=Arabidopsis suecica TaxID=45249 RepID=A0A8T2B4G5_ARASU|nr:F-box associated domain type 1 [Arabidopsis suecica]
MTTISDLPKELVEEIISRVPMKSMRAVRFTCKKWNRLYKSRSFIKMHIGGREMMIVLMDFNLYLMNVDVVDGDPSIETLGKLTFLNDSDQVKISEVFHCEGLLLCILSGDNNTRLVVWNPYCGQTRSIELRYSYISVKGCDTCSYAFGYVEKRKKNKSRRNHKILRFKDNDVSYHERDNFMGYDIYNFESDLWTTLDVTPHWYIKFFHLGISLKGNTYWCASERNPAALVDYIICFDFTRERFGPLLRLPFDGGIHDDVTLSCVREEKLSVLLQNDVRNPNVIEIWITTKIEADKVSWSKFLTVNTGPETLESFIIDEEKKVAMVLDDETFYILGEAGYFRELDLREPNHKGCYTHMCSYVPNLVQIKRPAGGGKRKLQSSLEKRRYDQKTSRLVALDKRIKKVNMNMNMGQTAQSSGGDVEKELKDAFKLYDIDCDGKISANELHVVMTWLGEKCTVESCVGMVQAIDVDGDGYISFEEFKTMMMRSMK